MNTPEKYEPFLPWNNLESLTNAEYRPDDRSGRFYLEDEKLRFVTEVAIVTQRPLLLRGEPGSGKSSFAPFVARNLNWRYYEQTVTGRTEAKDLLWRFDALRRLRDARDPDRKLDLSAENYLTPGPLGGLSTDRRRYAWRSFDPALPPRRAPPHSSRFI